MRLCLALGKTLAELRELITSSELPLWAAYESLHGLPLSRIEAVIATGASATVNSWGAKTTPKQFLPTYEHRVMSYAQGSEMFAAFAERHNQNFKAVA